MATQLLFIGTTELLLIGGLALLLFGGKKLPEMMKGLGQGVQSFKKGMNEPLAEELEGSIVGIAEDGVLTWEREGDLVVPTDAKKKAKYIKKNKSFTDYDSYDN